MTTSPSGPDAWTLFPAAEEGTGRAQEAVRLGSVCGRAGGPGRGLGWAVSGKPRAAHRLANRNQAERLSRDGERVQLRPSVEADHLGSSTPAAATCWPGWAIGWPTTPPRRRTSSSPSSQHQREAAHRCTSGTGNYVSFIR